VVQRPYSRLGLAPMLAPQALPLSTEIAADLEQDRAVAVAVAVVVVVVVVRTAGTAGTGDTVDKAAAAAGCSSDCMLVAAELEFEFVESAVRCSEHPHLRSSEA